MTTQIRHFPQHLRFIISVLVREQADDRRLLVHHRHGAVAELEEMEGLAMGQRHFLHL